MSRTEDGVFMCDCGAQCRPDQTEQCRRCGESICHSCSDIDDYLCVECQNAERQEKFENGEYIGQEVDDEEYGRGTIVLENEENVTVRAHEDGKMFVLPKSALIANASLDRPAASAGTVGGVVGASGSED